ncbi:hypothetical protein HRG_014932 [Hirsutella rhossiliensis]
MAKDILYDATVTPGATEYYGSMVLTNIRYKDGGSVTVKDFLGIIFKSPASVEGKYIYGSTNPWVELNPETINEQINSSTFVVTAKLHTGKTYKFNASDTITFGINGDLTQDTDRYTESFVLTADEVPDVSGTVKIEVADTPDSALKDNEQSVTFTQGQRILSFKMPLGTTTSGNVPEGTYNVTVKDLTTSDETTAATAEVDPDSVTVETGGETSVKVTYGDVKHYSAINLTIGKISGLEGEQFQVKVVEKSSGSTLAEFTSPGDYTTALRWLPSSGTAVISVASTTLNNVEYSFESQNQDLSAKLFEVSFSDDNVKKKDIDTKSFVKLPIKVDTDAKVDVSISVRLSSNSLNYTQTVVAEAGITPFDVLVGPGMYTVQVSGLLAAGVVYFVDTASSLDVAKDGSTTLEIAVEEGPNLNVRGFPSFLSFGGLTDLTSGNTDDFVAARATSIFKYAGVDGGGDPGSYLSNDTSTQQTLDRARQIEAKLGYGSLVLPIMISYTCNLSGGNPESHLQDEKGLMHSFGNFILALNLATATVDDDHPVPAGFVINPDLISACQQSNLPPEFPMPVREPLKSALEYRDISAEVPDSIPDTLRGYVLAVNWLVREVAPSVTFGWQVNLWGVGSSGWIYSTETSSNLPIDVAKQTTDYVLSLGVYEGDWLPDFIAVDRYEADDFTYRAYGNGYCYGPHEWTQYFNFCRAVSLNLKAPVMPWQIPSSRTPLVGDSVDDEFEPQHWGTGGSYILGDAGIGSDYHNINPKILNLSFGNSFPAMGKTGQDIFVRGEPFDLTNPAYIDFALRGIFTVLLGGGSTTGIVSSIGNPDSWVRDKLHAYMDNPISFDGSSSGGGGGSYNTRRLVSRKWGARCW